DGKPAGFAAAADVYLFQPHLRLGQIDLDPDLRRIVNLWSLSAEADAAQHHEREAIDAFAMDLHRISRGTGGGLVVEGFFVVLLPAAAVLRRPELDARDAGLAGFLDLVIELERRAVDEASRGIWIRQAVAAADRLGVGGEAAVVAEAA